MNQIEVKGDLAFIELGRGPKAVIDVASLPLVEGLNWRPDRLTPKRPGYLGYAIAHLGKRKYRFLHRLITSAPKGVQVDHINRDTLDNRLVNLRFCNNAENVANQGRRADNISGQRGVYLRANRSKRRPWVTSVRKLGKTMFERSFPTFEEAQAAYIAQAAIHFGEFANTEIQ